MEDGEKLNNDKHTAFDSKNYTIFEALVEAMRKKTEAKPKKRRFLSKLRPSRSTSKKEKTPPDCSHHFGYLESHPDFDPIPQECLTCQELLRCRNSDKSLFK